MIIYQAQKAEFLHDLRHRDIEEVILESYRARTGLKVSPREMKAWTHAALLENFSAAVEDHAIRLSPCAYLHNYDDPAGALLDPFYGMHLARASERRRELH